MGSNKVTVCLSLKWELIQWCQLVSRTNANGASPTLMLVLAAMYLHLAGTTCIIIRKIFKSNLMVCYQRKPGLLIVAVMMENEAIFLENNFHLSCGSYLFLCEMPFLSTFFA